MPARNAPQLGLEPPQEAPPRSLAELNRLIADAPRPSGTGRAVPGEGPPQADIVFVGEQPGDQEDRQGKPFVGPAGQLLDKAMQDAGIERGKTYVTNAVKHFKFEWRGKRRIHQTPTAGDVKHYRWWLQKELELVRPKRVVALGATAVLALAGKALPIGKNRGPYDFGEWSGYITVHPAFLLRLPGAEAKAREYAHFVRDLRRIRELTEEQDGVTARRAAHA